MAAFCVFLYLQQPAEIKIPALPSSFFYSLKILFSFVTGNRVGYARKILFLKYFSSGIVAKLSD